MPLNANGAAGTDGEALVVDGNIAYNFWQFVRTSATTATAQSMGETNIATGTGFGTASPFLSAGITAIGSSELGGLITQADQNAGVINHALQLVVDSTLAKPGFTGNAISGDGNSSTGIVQEGELLGIPSGTPMPAGLSPLAQEVFTAMQKYGAYVVDVAGGDTTIRAQENAFDSTTMTALWHDMGQITPLLEAVTPGSGSASSGTGATPPTTPTTPVTPTPPVTATAPTVAITSVGGTVTLAAQTITGTVDVADAGTKVNVLDGTTQVASATVGANGAWSANITLNQGANALTATDTNATGMGTSNAITETLSSTPTTPTAPTTPTSSTLPTLTIDNSTLHVSGGGGTVDLGIKETAPTSATAASITIRGLPWYETITDGFGDTFSGGRHGIRISEAQLAKGLTLTSQYQGAQDPVATLSITANATVAGVTSHSPTQTITVIDPPATSTSTSTTGKLALLNQYIASGFDHHSGSAPMMSNLAAAFGHDDSFLTSPRHAA